MPDENSASSTDTDHRLEVSSYLRELVAGQTEMKERLGRLENIVDGDEPKNIAGIGERVRRLEGSVALVCKAVWCVGIAAVIGFGKAVWLVVTSGSHTPSP